jgi:hypothetical protein
MKVVSIEKKGVSVKKCLFLTVGFEVLIIILAIGYYGYTANALQAIARYSGRLSLLIFAMIFILESQPFLLRDWLSKHYFFVFAVAHGIHLIELLMYVSVSGTRLIPYRIAGGALAYAIIFIMPLIHHLFHKQQIAPKTFSKWRHVYLYYVWFIFLMTYIPRVLGKLPQAGGTYAEHVLLLILVLAILAVRVAFILKPRSASGHNVL